MNSSWGLSIVGFSRRGSSTGSLSFISYGTKQSLAEAVSLPRLEGQSPFNLGVGTGDWRFSFMNRKRQIRTYEKTTALGW